ncbi:MAG: WGR domain-containing protein [Aureispira sp.]
MKQYLENTKGKSSKFWEVELEGQFLVVNYGKIGQTGRQTRKDLKTTEKAYVAFKKEVLKKRKGGYIDPKQPIPTLSLAPLEVNNTTFRHKGDVEAIYYYNQHSLVITATNTHFSCWTTEGTLLAKHQFSEEKYFFGHFSIKAIPNTDQIIIHKNGSRTPDTFYIFDCHQKGFELAKEHSITVPIEGYFRQIDVDKDYIYFGYTGGFMLLDYDFEIQKTLTSPQKHENSNGTIVSATSQLIAFVEYAGYGNKGDKVLIIDLEGNTVSQFKASVHHSSYGMMAYFNAAGTIFHTTASSNAETKVQLWDPYKGTVTQEMANYSSTGMVLHFANSVDDDWMVIRAAGVDLILWNLREEAVAWVKTNQDLDAHIAFGPDQILYQSVGNRILPLNKADGVPQQEIQGLANTCQRLFFDNKNQLLWALGGKTACCFNPDGSIHSTTDITDFIAGKVEGKMLVKRRLGTYGGSYAWLDLTTREETPILSGNFRAIDYNAERVITTASYFAPNKKVSHLWSHSGKQLKEMKLGQELSGYLWKQGQFITTKGKHIDLWELGDKKPRLSIKKAHQQEIGHLVVAPNQATFLSHNKTEIKLWDGTSMKPLLFELVESPPVKVLVKDFLETYLIFTEKGAIYSLHPETLHFQQIAQLSAAITQATVTAKGQLYVATTALDITQVDCSPYLTITTQQSSPKNVPTLDWNSLGDQPTEAALLDFMSMISWEKLKEEEFLTLKVFLEQQATIGKAHHYFTQQLLETGAYLRHEFAHEEATGSFAMSPDGAYLAIGTWVGDSYEEDGTVQIWEMATGRCVNLLQESYGGIGWPDYHHMLQWSPNSQYLGAGIDTNAVVKLHPFSDAPKPMSVAYITNGWSRPPAWSWQGHQDAFVISCWGGNSEIPVGITSNKKLQSYEDDAQWMNTKLAPAIQKQLTREDLQPYHWCAATKDGQVIYGYNRHDQVFAVSIESKQVLWLKNLTMPLAFSAVTEVMAYQNEHSIVVAAIRTGEIIQQHPYDQQAGGIQYASTGQVFAVYNKRHITLYNTETTIAILALEEHIQMPYSSMSELTPIQFSPSGEKIAVLLNNGKVQIWTIQTPQLLTEFKTTGNGLYWGNSLVVVDPYHLSFYQEDGTLIRQCNKEQQVDAYNELYDRPKPFATEQDDYGDYQEIQPYYPLYKNDKKEWIAVLATGLVISPSGTLEDLKEHLSYTYQNKYAWPYSWGGVASLYQNLYEAKEDPKLGLSDKDKALLKEPNKGKKKKKKAGISFTKGGTILDLIKVHQTSLSELSSGWNYHISEHNGVIARKLLQVGEYEQAIKIAAKSKEWYMLVSNLGFLAADLANKKEKQFAEAAFEQGVKALEEGKGKDRDAWAATFVYAPLAAAAQLLGKETTSQQYFKLALQKIEEESNTFEKYSHLATSYLLCGQINKALDVLYNGPIEGSWFSSYQMEFLIQLLQQGHLEQALAYFDHSLDAYGSIDEFDLLDAGMAALLAQNNYEKAIVWMQKFGGLSKDGAETVLLEQLAQKKEVTVATNWLLQKLEEVKKYGNSSIKYIFFLSQVNPKEAQQQLKQLPTGQTIYYRGTYYEHLGKIKSNLKSFKDVKAILTTIPQKEHQFLYLLGLLDSFSFAHKKKQLAILQQAVELLEEIDQKAETTIKYLIRLAGLAKALEAQEDYIQLSNAAKELAEKNKDLGFYSFNDFQRLYIDLDLMEEAHALFLKQTPANRKSGMRTYALAIAQKGYIKTAAQLLMTLPAKDLNDRPSAAMDIIKAL